MRLNWKNPNILCARVIVLTATVTFAAVFLVCQLFGIRLNPTASLPPGLYRIVGMDADSDLVAFCPSGAAERDSILRGYRPRGMQCPDHYAPIMKPIAARPGDRVTVTRKGILVNGTPLPNTQQFTKDNRQRPMNPWPEGTYTVAPGTLWVVSTYNKYSFDSRYYGPIYASQVIAHVKPLWTTK
jgi:conjugative transfer signal peptidase TraF